MIIGCAKCLFMKVSVVGFVLTVQMLRVSLLQFYMMMSVYMQVSDFICSQSFYWQYIFGNLVS